MPGQVKTKIPDLYSQIAHQEKQKVTKKNQQVVGKAIKKREPISHDNRIPLKNV